MELKSAQHCDFIPVFKDTPSPEDYQNGRTKHVGALQLLRTVVDRQDSHLAQYLANEVLEGVWELFTEHESRVFSLCLSLQRAAGS